MTQRVPIFVTGGTGFIGTRLVQELLARGERVRVLARRSNPQPPIGFESDDKNPWKHPNVELVSGDITDAASIDRGMAGCDRVFHLAAYAKNWARHYQTYVDMNIGGMRNVFDAAERHGVRRIVWTSTMLTFGPTPPGVVGDEAMPRYVAEPFTAYEATKMEAEKEAFARAAAGLPVVIVNPGRVFGPGHLTEGNSLSLLIDQYDRGLVPVLLNWGVNVGNYVLVDDVVQGHLLAMERGRIGERYLLGGDNVSLREFFRLIDRVSGKRHWQIPIGKYLPLFFAWAQKKGAEWFGIYPQITPPWVRVFLTEWAYSSAKAERELGYRYTPLEEGLRITYEWIKQTRAARKKK